MLMLIGLGSPDLELTRNDHSAAMTCFIKAGSKNIRFISMRNFKSFILSVEAVAPPEIFRRGGQMGPVKILGWHTKTTV